LGTTMITYRVKADLAAINTGLIERVFAELQSAAPDDFSYASFISEDGVSFTHLVSNPSDMNPLMDMAAFREFQLGIAERCEVGPAFQALRNIGSYGFGKIGAQSRSESTHGD
jgi:hypothetical protein